MRRSILPPVPAGGQTSDNPSAHFGPAATNPPDIPELPRVSRPFASFPDRQIGHSPVAYAFAATSPRPHRRTPHAPHPSIRTVLRRPDGTARSAPPHAR